MSDVWTDSVQLSCESEAHREGPDLDLLVEWAAGPGSSGPAAPARRQKG